MLGIPINVMVIIVGLQGQPAEGFALVQQPQGQDERKAKAGTMSQELVEAHAMAPITLDLERGGPCGEETKETKKRRRKDGDKAEDADRGGANVRWDVGRRRDWCASVRVGAPTVGGLGSEGDKTVLLGPKNWNPISSSKWTLLARHG